jgi:membrane-bound lytic murein transglycosylase A
MNRVASSFAAGLAAVLAVSLGGCVTPSYPVEGPARPTPSRPGPTKPGPTKPEPPRVLPPRTYPTTPPRTSPGGPTTPTPSGPAPSIAFEPASFDQLPGWAGTDPSAAREAFRRQCALWARKDAQSLLTQSDLGYGGRIADWAPACQEAVQDGDPRAFFERNFTPWRVTSEGGEAKLTAYYAPSIAARRTRQAGFTEPLLPVPNDMLIIDIPAFAEALDSESLRKVGARLKGRLKDGRVVPYADRAEIARSGRQGFAWAHPADVYNLQVQGSGRLTFPGGETACAAFAEQNGYKWRSALGPVTKRTDWPRNPAGTWASLKQYWDEHPEAVRPDLDADPSYVFFQEKPGRDGACATGASGALLVGGGSMAVDPRYHPYGAPIFLVGASAAAGGPLPALMIAQDTGGAIKRGPLRGDLYLGEGREAGVAAERVNVAGPAFWVLLPTGMQPPAPKGGMTAPGGR